MTHARAARCAAATLAVVVPSLLVTRGARAYRPFDGTDAAVADVGEFELELGPAHLYGRGANHYVIAPATVLNLGLVEGLELVVDYRGYVGLERVPSEPRVRLLDTDVFLKWVLRRGTLQDEEGVSIAIEGGPLVPEFGGERSFGAQADVIFSYEWPFGAIHFNEQVALTRLGNLDGFSSVILEGAPESSARPVAEVFVERELGVGSTYSALVGGIWTVSESLALDAGLRVASVEGERAEEVRLGFTWAVPIWSDQNKPRRATRPMSE